MLFKSFMYEPNHYISWQLSGISPFFLQVVAQKFQWRDIPGESEN